MAVAQFGVERCATAVLKSNLIQSIEFGTAVARRLALASCYAINKIHLIHLGQFCLDLPNVTATHSYRIHLTDCN